jgi:hypothetical protein
MCLLISYHFVISHVLQTQKWWLFTLVTKSAMKLTSYLIRIIGQLYSCMYWIYGIALKFIYLMILMVGWETFFFVCSAEWLKLKRCLMWHEEWYFTVLIFTNTQKIRKFILLLIIGFWMVQILSAFVAGICNIELVELFLIMDVSNHTLFMYATCVNYLFRI